MLSVALALLLQTSDFAAARARLEALNAQEAALAERVGKNRAVQSRLLSALQTARRDPPPALLVSPKSAKDAVRAAILMRALEPELERRAKALSAETLALTKLRREAAEASSAFFAAESAVADRAARSGARAPKQALASIAPSPSPLAPLSPPVKGDIVRRYGEVWEGRGRSEGLAWRTESGAAVASPAAGRVEYVGPLKNWGLVVILLRPDGWRAVVAGLQSADLAPGSLVQPGQAIGRMPDRRSPPPELYLELRRGENPIDPAPYVLAAPKPATG